MPYRSYARPCAPFVQIKANGGTAMPHYAFKVIGSLGKLGVNINWLLDPKHCALLLIKGKAAPLRLRAAEKNDRR